MVNNDFAVVLICFVFPPCTFSFTFFFNSSILFLKRGKNTIELSFSFSSLSFGKVRWIVIVEGTDAGCSKWSPRDDESFHLFFCFLLALIENIPNLFQAKCMQRSSAILKCTKIHLLLQHYHFLIFSCTVDKNELKLYLK